MYNILFIIENNNRKDFFMNKVNKTKRKRIQCSDCYYNGNCLIPLSQCKYITKRKKDIL